MKIFVNNVDGYIATSICADLRRFGDVSHTLIGTLKPGCDGVSPPCVQKIVSRAAPRKLLKAALGCDVVVYDLHDADLEELEFVLKALKVSELGHDLTFILVSSVQVWGRTKRQYEPRPVPVPEEVPVDGADGAEAAATEAPPAEAAASAEGSAEGEDVAAEEAEKTEVKVEMQPEMLCEDDYARRVPAPKYQEWKTLETLVLALKEKEGITPYVVGAGVPYGNGEECLYDVFKSAWLGRPTHRLIAPGNNFIPMVHTRDLARLVRTVVIDKPERPYFLAVDSSSTTQKELINTVVTEMSDLPSEIPVIPTERSLLAEFTDVMTMDLRLQPSELMTAETFRWWSGDGIVANFQKVADEFNRWRRLAPIKIFLLGPPGGGAEQLAPLVAENYRLTSSRYDKLMSDVCNSENNELGETLKAKLQEIADIANNPKLAAAGIPTVPMDLLLKVIEDALQSKVSLFRGYTCAGFPLSMEEAEAMFLEDAPVEAPPEGEAEAEAAAAEPPAEEQPPPEKIPRERYITEKNPPHIFILSNSDDAQCLARAKEDEWFNEADFKRKTEKYKKDNLGEEEKNLLADWFEEKLKITPTVIDVSQVIADGGTLEDIAAKICEEVDSKDPPFNFLPVVKEKVEEVVEEQVDDTDAAAREEELKAQEREQQRKEAEEAERLEAVKKTEQQLLEKYSESLRQYLTAFVVPTLTKGLIEVCQEQPTDPIDYLAEYLFAFHSQSQPPAPATEEAAA
jgi:adenylate kinase